MEPFSNINYKEPEVKNEAGKRVCLKPCTFERETLALSKTNNGNRSSKKVVASIDSSYLLHKSEIHEKIKAFSMNSDDDSVSSQETVILE